ncbi:FlgN protein [Opitutaceae bacterium TAV1]|nr:FlgN protein [Opitutaceae bacterium TAV1]
MNNTATACEELLAALREELAGYGGVLALFDEQQTHLWNRDAARVAATAVAIDEMMQTVSRQRSVREAWVAGFARARHRPATSTLLDLLPLFPEDTQILLRALVTEISRLLRRVRRRARQNHQLLTRVCQLHHELLALVRPDSRADSTYSADGRLPAPAGSTLRIAG